jgi:hypothetical protein
LYKLFSTDKPIKTKLNKEGYAVVGIYNSTILRKIKYKVIELNLPILSRKWEQIDLNFISRNEQCVDNVILIKKYLSDGKSQKTICELLHMKSSNLSQLIKRKNLKNKKEKI